jgi:hypothetical protein
VGAESSCDDFVSWRDAQDALEADPDVNQALDPYGDEVACVDDLAQPEYEDGWSDGYLEACGWVFAASSTGALYGDDGSEYTVFDCENADPGPGDWEVDTFSEPGDDGGRDGWTAACEETFGPSVAFSDLQLEAEGIYVTQFDCENENPY